MTRDTTTSPERLGYASPHAPDAPAAPGPRWMGVALLLGAALLWSVSGLAVKWADTDPIAFTTLRSVGAMLAMAPLLGLGARLTGRARPRGDLMAITALMHTIMVGAFISAMTYASAAEGIFLQYSAPAWAAIFGWLLLRRRVDRATIVALIVAMAGIAVILGMEGGGGDGSARARWLGPMLGVIAGIGYGGVILSLDAIDADARRRTGTTSNIFLIVFVNNLASGLILGPWAVARGMLEISPALIGAILLFGAVQMAAPYILFQLGLRRVGPVAAGLIALAEPILNPVWAWLGAGEVPPRSIYFGGALILTAVVITAVFGNKRGVATKQGEANDLALPAQ